MPNQLRSRLARLLLPLSLLSLPLSPLAIQASESKDPEVPHYTHHAMGCMLLEECTDGVTQIFSMQGVREHFGENGLYDYDPHADEFNAMVHYLNEMGVKVFIGPEKYFTRNTRGLYQSKHNVMFLNELWVEKPATLMSVMRHEGWHAAQDCMAGTVDNAYLAIIMDSRQGSHAVEGARRSHVPRAPGGHSSLGVRGDLGRQDRRDDRARAAGLRRA